MIKFIRSQLCKPSFSGFRQLQPALQADPYTVAILHDRIAHGRPVMDPAGGNCKGLLHPVIYHISRAGSACFRCDGCRKRSLFPGKGRIVQTVVHDLHFRSLRNLNGQIIPFRLCFLSGSRIHRDPVFLLPGIRIPGFPVIRCTDPDSCRSGLRNFYIIRNPFHLLRHSHGGKPQEITDINRLENFSVRLRHTGKIKMVDILAFAHRTGIILLCLPVN